MKSNVSGRVLSQSGSSSSSSGCRPQQNFFYNFHHHQNQSHQQQQQHQNHHQQQPYHPHHHQQPPPPSQHQNYAMLPCFNQHNANGWAGIPLISTAASSNRRQRKPTVGGGQRHPPPPPPQSMSCNSLQQIYNSNRDLHSNEYDMNPMTRLAMHTQGAPLLLSGSYNRNRLNCNRQLRPLNPNSSEGYNSPCGNGGSGVGGFKPNVPIHHQKTKENNISGPVGSCGGVTNTQSDSATVACLPRIIKPRKRRKKDRKPLPNTTNFIKKMDHETDTGGVFPRRDHHQLYIDQNQHQHHITLPSSSQMLSGGGDCGNGFNEFETIRCNLKNDEPSHVTDAQDPATGSICFCRQCDPLSRIWAFPLRRSHSDNSSDTTEFERATINKNVGVIGSNRSQVNLKTTTTGSLSDSSDSGYGDILSGIQIGDNFFQNNHDNNNYLQLQKLPNDLLLSPTAESLLTESINEISRKLMETCDIKGASTGGSIGCGSSSSSSSSSSTSDSCSVFSDSGLSSATSNNPPSGDELIFNFENLSINSLNQHHPNLLFPNATNVNNESMFDCFSTSADINNNTIYVPASDGGGGGGGVGSPRIDPQLFNCLDMLWGTHSTHSSSLLMHSDAPKQISSSPSSSSTTSSSSSSSSTSFYRPAVASI